MQKLSESIPAVATVEKQSLTRCGTDRLDLHIGHKSQLASKPTDEPECRAKAFVLYFFEFVKLDHIVIDQSLIFTRQRARGRIASRVVRANGNCHPGLSASGEDGAQMRE